MSPAWFLQTLVAAPFFASRAFLATFVTALLARFGPSVPWLGGSEAVEVLARAPAWFTHDATLLTLGAVAAVELLATRNADARRLMDSADSWMKACLSLLVSLAILSPSDAALFAPQTMGLGEVFVALFPAALVLGLAQLRGRFFGFLSDVDEDDDLGLQRLVIWAEDGWVVFGLSFAIFFPLLALVLFVLSLGAMAAMQRGADRVDARRREACSVCAHPNHLTAPHCSACRTPRAEPSAVGLFGQASSRRVDDDEQHALELVARKRCPFCAERLRGRSPALDCAACGTTTFANQHDLDRYLTHLDRQLPRTMVVCLAFSAVPLLGIVPGVIYYRLSLVSGLARYVPPTANFATRWGVRLINLVLILGQPIPILGAFLLPLMCGTNYALYRRALLRAAK